jgi:hypothetical protein
MYPLGRNPTKATGSPVNRLYLVVLGKKWSFRILSLTLKDSFTDCLRKRFVLLIIYGVAGSSYIGLFP